MVDCGADTTIIAELANAHEGDVATAIEMIDGVAASADAVKIQVFSAADVAVESHEQYDLYEQLSLDSDEIGRLVDAAHERNVDILADVEGEDGISRLERAAVDGFKIHSSDLSRTSLLERVAELGKPVLLSAGGVTPLELRKAIEAVETGGDVPVSVVYGFQNYPTEVSDAHLHRLRQLDDIVDCPVGYASHVDGGTDVAKQLPAWAIAAGAAFVEVHVTLDRSAEGIDYYSSLEPDDFAEMASRVDTAQAARGPPTVELSASEREYRSSHKKCVVAMEALSAGDTIDSHQVSVKRPVGSPRTAFKSVAEVAGKKVLEPIERFDAIESSHVEQKVVAALACRSESTRLYGKPLQRLGEKPILQHQIDRLRDVPGIDEVALAISDAPSQRSFVDFAEENGLSYVVDYPENVLGRLVSVARATDADTVVRSTTENPFLYYDIIDDLVGIAKAENADLVAPRKLPFGSFVEVFDRDALEDAQQYGDDRHRSEHVASFLTDHPASFRIVGVEPPEAVKRPGVRLTVDNPSDLVLVRQLWENIADAGDPYDLKAILEHYDDAELGTINAEKPDGTTESVVADAWHIYGDPDGRMQLLDVSRNPIAEQTDGEQTETNASD